MERKILVVSACLIEKNGKFLLVQEKQSRAYKLWNLPAGRLEPDTNLIENAIREAKEETGYDVKIESLAGIFQNLEKKDRNVVIFVFKANIIGGELKVPEDEIFQAKWFTLEELKNMKNELRGDYMLKAIENYNQNKLLPLDIIDLTSKT